MNWNLNQHGQAKLGWQMFIPPLPKHCGWPNGWAFLCDILLRLPLSIFVKVRSVPCFGYHSAAPNLHLLGSHVKEFK